MVLHLPATNSFVITPHERGLLAATFYLAGGLTALLASMAPHAHTRSLAALGLTCLTVAGGSYLLRHSFAYWATLASSIAGPMLIAAGILAGNGGPASAVMAALFAFVAVHTALVLPWEYSGIIQLWGATSAVTASWLVAPDVPLAFVAATYLLVCGTLWGVTTRVVEHVRRQAATDPLTGLANRAAFNNALDHSLATVQRTHEPLSLVALDLDEFKLLNDTHGHAAGDASLIAVANAWSYQLRARDTLARTGGDEFIAILPGASPARASHVGARLQDATPVNISCSVGVTTWTSEQTAEQLVAAADHALYQDKAQRHDPTATKRPGCHQPPTEPGPTTKPRRAPTWPSTGVNGSGDRWF